MLKKLLKSLLGHSSSPRPYRKYSSSDMRHGKYPHNPQGHGHSYYGNSHYKKKHSSRSFFSS